LNRLLQDLSVASAPAPRRHRDHAVSVSYCRQPGPKIFGELTGMTVLLVGAPGMVEPAWAPPGPKVGCIVVAAPWSGLRLAERYRGRPSPGGVGGPVASADILISSTGAGDYLLRRTR
jgi:hypothetical protein